MKISVNTTQYFGAQRIRYGRKPGAASVPDAPTALIATAGDTEVDLTWTAPVDNGGSAITDYVVEWREAL